MTFVSLRNSALESTLGSTRTTPLGRATYDAQKRQQIYKDLQTQWYNTAWWGFIWLQPQNYIMSKRVKSTPAFLSPQSGVFLSFWHEEALWLDS